MFDKIEKIGKSVIQHGDMNKRIYIMKLDESDFPQILDTVDNLAKENEYTKIFAKVPAQFKERLANLGYVQEACIPNFYDGENDAVFMGKYFDETRKKEQHPDTVKRNLKIAEEKKDSPAKTEHNGYEFAKLTPDDVQEAAKVYELVFKRYPFPIFDPVYLNNTMKSHIDYFCVRHQGKIIALASAEKDEAHSNAEMTDFATLPEYRGKGLASELLKRMETEMKIQGIKTMYTIARAMSAGMNVTFAKAGYEYCGTLINNTHIYSGLESMNIWYKPVS